MTAGVLLIIIAALLLFGPNKLPELGRAVGKTFREFKDATRDIVDDEPAVKKSESEPVPIQQPEQSSQRRLPE